MERIKPHTLSGFMELLPRQQALFDGMKDVIRSTYELYGFTGLDTPDIEASEVLLAKAGGETEKQIYRFTKGDTDLSLRFDLTVPLAKYVALHQNELSFPFRRYQVGKVHRGERAQRGRFREFYQADIDVIGDGSLDIVNDAEMPAIIYQVFTRLGLTRFKIRVNNRKILNGLFAALGLSDKAADVMRTIDKLEKIGPGKVTAILTEDFAVPAGTADKLMGLLAASDPLAALAAFAGQNELLDQGVAELSSVTKYLAAFGVPADHFEVDLTIARGLDYYTGTVYETQLLDYPEIGSPCSGGRYDNLAEYYTDKQLPGVGISIGLTRLFYVLEEQGLLNPDLNAAPADVLILPMTEDLSPAIALATAWRSAAIRVQIYTEPKKFKARMNYANKLGVPFVALLGEEELAAGEVALKNMLTGQQERVKMDAAAGWLLSRVAPLCAGAVIREKDVL